MQLKRVALLMGKSIGYNRDVIEGIYAYSQKRKNWIFHDAAPRQDAIAWVKEWQPDGIIGHFYDKKIARSIEKLGVPIVNTTDSLIELNYPLTDVNQESVGKMAAEYLTSLGLENFAYLGSSKMQYSKQRFSAFKAEIDGKVHRCAAEYLPRISDFSKLRSTLDTMRDWVSKLPKPVGIFCSNDVPARDLADVCLELGIKVPEDVAILGVDNDLVECRLSRPPLSSIEIPSARIGYGAAEMLDQLMQTGSWDPVEYRPDPLRIVERESTSLFVSNDIDIQLAQQYIKEHFSVIESVNEVVAQTKLGRRALEIRFQKELGVTILETINLRRITKAKYLLRETKQTLSEIADTCGFKSARRFSEIFSQCVGAKVGEYRPKLLSEPRK